MQGRFGRSAVDVFTLAASEAHSLGCQFIGSDLILLALLKLEGRCAEIFRRLDLDFEKTCAFIKATVLTNNVSGRDLDSKEFSSDAKTILLAARSETMLLSREAMLEEHLLLGILREPETVAGALLKHVKIDLKLLRREVRRSAINNTEISEDGSAYNFGSPLPKAALSKRITLNKPKAPNAVRLETDAFSSDTVQLLANTQWLAVQMGAPSVELEHLFYAALTQDTYVKDQLLACGAENSELEAFSGAVAGRSLPKKVPEVADVLRKTIGHSMEVASLWQSYQVEPEHLFLSMSDLKIAPSELVLFPQFEMAAFLRTIRQTVQQKCAKIGAPADVIEQLKHARLESQLAESSKASSAEGAKRLSNPAYEHLPGEVFNAPCREALRVAAREAKNFGQVEICPEILLLGLISLTGELPQRILAQHGIDFAMVKSRCMAIFQGTPTGGSSELRGLPIYNEMVTLILNFVYLKAQGNSSQATPEDILKSMLTLSQGHINALFSDLAVTCAELLLVLGAATAIVIKSENLGEGLLFERLDKTSLNVLRLACDKAACGRQDLIASEHLLIGLLSVTSPAQALLHSQALDEKVIAKALAGLQRLPQPDFEKMVEMPSGGAYPLLNDTDLRPTLSPSARVLNSDCLHIFNLAAAFAKISSSQIQSLDLLMGLLASRAGLGFRVLTALDIDAAELYRNCYKLKNSP